MDIHTSAVNWNERSGSIIEELSSKQCLSQTKRFYFLKQCIWSDHRPSQTTKRVYINWQRLSKTTKESTYYLNTAVVRTLRRLRWPKPWQCCTAARKDWRQWRSGLKQPAVAVNTRHSVLFIWLAIRYLTDIVTSNPRSYFCGYHLSVQYEQTMVN